MITIHTKSHEDQFILDNSTVRRFIDAVNGIRFKGMDPHAAGGRDSSVLRGADGGSRMAT